jgi:predicted nucleic acid-binding protein
LSLVVADTSTWVRASQPAVAAELARAASRNELATLLPLTLELLVAARDAAELRQKARRYDALHQIDVTPAVGRRARAVQADLAWRGYHRGPSPVDLIAAAAAELAGAELWHCDRHFDLIGSVTGQPMRRVGR